MISQVFPWLGMVFFFALSIWLALRLIWLRDELDVEKVMHAVTQMYLDIARRPKAGGK